MAFKKSVKELREFGFLIVFGFPIFLGWLLPFISGHLFRYWTLWISIPFLICTIFSPKSLIYPYKCWMFLGRILGWVNSRLILGLVYVIVLQPIALFMRIFGYDPLRKNQNSNNSYREDKKGSKVDLTRIF